jgi:hypothetical protein
VRSGVSYAQGAKDRPEYLQTARDRGVSSFNVAASDFLHPPEVPELDLSNYEGKTGQTIRARAIDDVLVTRVTVVIATDQNVVIEKGEMTRHPLDKTLWTYATAQDANATHVKVIVEAADLPGHTTSKEADKTL